MSFRTSIWTCIFILLGICKVYTAPNISLTSPPTATGQSEPVNFSYINRGKSSLHQCEFKYSTSPRGPQIAGHTLSLYQYIYSTDTGLSFIPNRSNGQGIAQLSIGTIYYIITCASDSGVAYTAEYPLQVEAENNPIILNPGATTKTTTPIFSWSPVAGVPAYHILISDQVIQLSTESFSPYGASIIWQAITTQTSITYGSQDPSGFFKSLRPPPLSAGQSYTLILFNNYDGRSPNATSTRTKDFKIFKIEVPASPSIKKPVLISPSQGDSLSSFRNPDITFKWNSSGKNTLGYQLYLYSEESYSGFDTTVAIPIWNGETTDTSITLSATKTLGQKKYLWKVFANASNGLTLVSDTSAFSYKIASQPIEFKTTTLTSTNDSIPIEGTIISYTTPDGTQSTLPLQTLSDGTISRSFPIGIYTFTFSKEGYESTIKQIDLSTLPNHNVTYRLDISLSKLKARLTGQVIDKNGNGISLALITLESKNGLAYSTHSDAYGIFQLGTEAGSYELSISHNEFLPRKGILIQAIADTTKILGTYTLDPIQTFFSGRILSSTGNALSSSRITITSKTNSLIRSEITSLDNGNFQVPLAIGKYLIEIIKSGYASYYDSIQVNSNIYTEIILKPVTGILSGEIKTLTYQSPSVTTTSQVEDIFVKVNFKNSKKTYTTWTNKNGVFSFSLSENGPFQIAAILPGASDSIFTNDTLQQNSTKNIRIFIPLFPQINGAIQLNPPANVNISECRVSLVSAYTNKISYEQKPYIQNNQMHFLFPYVRPGLYHLFSGVAGYGQNQPMDIFVDTLWQSNLDILLTQSSNQLAFSASSDSEKISGHIELFLPLRTQLLLGDTLKNAPLGAYMLSINPSVDTIFSAENIQFSIGSNTSQDTSILIDIPYRSYKPKYDLLTRMYTTSFEHLDTSTFDSAFINISVNDITIKTAIVSTANPIFTYSYHIANTGGNVQSYFEIYRKGILYSNKTSSFSNSILIPAKDGLSQIKAYPSDTLSVQIGDPFNTYIRSFGGNGASLDQVMQNGQSIYWYTLDPAKKMSDSLILIKKNVERRYDSLQSEIHKALVLLDSLTFSRDSILQILSQMDSLSDSLHYTSLIYRTPIDSLDQIAQKYPIQLTYTYGLQNQIKLIRDITSPLPVMIRGILGNDTIITTIWITPSTSNIHRLVLSSSLGNRNEVTTKEKVEFQVMAFDTTTTPFTRVYTNYTYKLLPPNAGVIDRDVLVLDSNFFGPLRIWAIHRQGRQTLEAELSLGTDSLNQGIQVIAEFNPPFHPRTLFHNPEIEVALADSFLFAGTNTKLKLQKRNLNTFFTSTKNLELKSTLFEIINLSGIGFRRTPLIRMSVINESDYSKSYLAMYRDSSFSWEFPAASTQNAVINKFGAYALQIPLNSFEGTYYGILGQSKPLGVSDFLLMPNPFSPHITATRDGNTQPGLRIQFYPHSKESDRVLATLKVYNLRGELIRTLLDNVSQPKKIISIYWDGLTDGGRDARNGRYILMLLLQESNSGKTTKHLKNVVLFH